MVRMFLKTISLTTKLLFVLYFIGSCASADTIIDSNISSNTTWNSAGSPYIITYPIAVESGITLNISEGTEIYFDDYMYISVFGNLNVAGTELNPVRFSKNAEAFGGWSLYFFNSAGSSLNHVVLDDMDFMILEGSNLDVNNSRIQDGLYGISAYYSSDLEIFNSTVNILSGYIEAQEGSLLTINNSSVSSGPFDDMFSVLVKNDSTLMMSGATIIPTFGDGIEVNGSTAFIENSKVLNGQGSGIVVHAENSGNFYSSVVTITNTEIKNFIENGLSSFGRNKITILDSDILENYTGLSLNERAPPVFEFLGQAEHNFVGGEMAFLDGVDIEVASSSITNNVEGISLYDYLDGEVKISDSEIKDNDVGVVMFGDPEAIISFDLRNNWWGDKTGPFHDTENLAGLGDPIVENQNIVEFSPWLEAPLGTTVVTCCSNVLFIPGFEGSRLYKERLLDENQLWEPNFVTDVIDLYFNSNEATSKNTKIYTRDIVKKGLGVVEIYDNFLQYMNNFASSSDFTFKSFPYDWRYSIDDVVNGIPAEDDPINNKSPDLISILKNLKESSKNGKVTLIAHSNGGLVAKALIRKLENSASSTERELVESVDKMIFVGVPHLGAMATVAALETGYDQALGFGVVLSKDVAKTFGHDISGAYTLLPSKKYFDFSTTSVVKIDVAGLQGISSISNYSQDILSYDAVESFLKAELDYERSSYADGALPVKLRHDLMDEAEDFHDIFDSYSIPTTTKVYNITGYGLETVLGMEYVAKDCFLLCDKKLDVKPITSIKGDRTVPWNSSVGYENVEKQYYFDLRRYNDSNSKREHKNILSNDSVESLVKNIIEDATSTISYIGESIPDYSGIKINSVSVHSPVSITLIDSQNRITGLEASSTLENIPNSYYMEFGEGKYVGYQDNPDNPVSIMIRGTGVGTFSVESKQETIGQSESSLSINNIPVTPLLSAELIFSTTTLLNIDADGDGHTETIVDLSEELSTIDYLNILRQTIIGFNLDEKIENRLLNKIDRIKKLIEKGKIKNSKQKIKNFSKKLNSKKFLSKKLILDQKNTLADLFNNLLDELEK